MILKLFVPVANEQIAQPICEAALVQAGLAAGIAAVPAREVCAFAGGSVQTGTVWTLDLPTGDALVTLGTWIKAGAEETLDLAPWTQALDPRATALRSWKIRPTASNPYGLPVYVVGG